MGLRLPCIFSFFFYAFLLVPDPLNAQVNYIANPEFREINQCCEYMVSCAPEGWWTTSGGTFNFEDVEYDKNKQAIPKPALVIVYNSVFPNNRSYIQAPVLCPLVEGDTYLLTLEIRPRQTSIGSFSAYFSDSFLNIPKKQVYVIGEDGFFKIHNIDSLLTFAPQLNFTGKKYLHKGPFWVRLSAEYIATGKEKFLVLGNFEDDQTQRRRNRLLAGKKSQMHFYGIRSVGLYPLKAGTDCETDVQLQVLNEMNRRHTFYGTCEDTVPVNMNYLFARSSAWSRAYHNQRMTGDSRATRMKEIPNIEAGRPYRLSNVFFGFDSSVLRSESYPELDSLAGLLKWYNDYDILILGHTDSLGNADYNLRLSADRAQAVMEYLISKGIEPFRIESEGLGASRPISNNTTEEGRQLNRRVEFMLIKK